jgi:co-chaperonin GroES (HSP10)
MQSKYQNARFNKGHILVKQIMPPKKTDSGIIISAEDAVLETQESFFKGEVITKAEDVTFCNVGDTVLTSYAYPKVWGERDEIANEKVLFALIKESEIIAVL